MKFTEEQFKEIGPFYMDDFPIDDSNQKTMFNIFNDLPDEIQGLALAWGCQDTEVREKIFTWVCKAQLDMTVEEYYNSDIAKNYFENDVLIEYKCKNK